MPGSQSPSAPFTRFAMKLFIYIVFKGEEPFNNLNYKRLLLIKKLSGKITLHILLKKVAYSMLLFLQIFVHMLNARVCIVQL